MNDVNTSLQNDDEEFEYIELEEGQELPEGYEYVELPEDDVSEMDVVNDSYAFAPDEDENLVSSAEIHSAISSSQPEENIQEVPFPSFLQAEPKEPSWHETLSKAPEIEVEDVEVTYEEPQQDNKTWQSTPGIVQPEESDAQDDIQFLNDAEKNENWQEDTRAIYDLDSVKADTSDIDFQENKVSSLDVNAYTEPEAVYTAHQVSEKETASEHGRLRKEKETVENNQKNLSTSTKVDKLSELDLDDAADISLDELLEEDEPLVEVDHISTDLSSDNKFIDQESENNISSQTATVEDMLEDISPSSQTDYKSSHVEDKFVHPDIDTKVLDKAENNITDDHEKMLSTPPVLEVAPTENQNKINVDVKPAEKVKALKNDTEINSDYIFSISENLSVTKFLPEDIAQAETKSRLISKNDGVQYFKADDIVSDIILSDVDFSQNELSLWNLVLFDKQIIPLEEKVAELEMPKHPYVNRFVSVVQNGERKFDAFNEDDLKILNTSEACVAVKGNFVCGDFKTNSGLIVDDYMSIPLADFSGMRISFNIPASGLLTGPLGTLLFFFGVKNLWVPNSDVAAVDMQKLQYKISKWYSGTLHDQYYEFSAQSESAEFIGSENKNAIHVNVSTGSYGWNVMFDNGISMNLRDLREYQTRFGKMPFPSGIISYGAKKLKFQNVERIVIYETAQYFFYS